MSAERSLPADSTPEVESKQVQEAITSERLKKQESLKRILTLGRGVLGISAKTLAMMTATAVPMVAVSAYGFDVNYEKSLMEHAQPYVIENSPVPESQDAAPAPIPYNVYRAMDEADRASLEKAMKPSRWAIFNGPGFGLPDTFQAASTLSGFDKFGANVSLHYGNNGINIPAITSKVVEYIKENKIDKVGFYGDSLGCDVVFNVAAELHEQDPDVHIGFIITDACAGDASVVRPKSRSDAYTLINAAHLPDSGYSRFARQAAELYLRKDEIFKDPTKLPEINGEVYDEIFENHDLASNNMLIDQAQILFNPKLLESMKKLGDQPEADRPIIASIGAKHFWMDDVVNTPKSIALTKKYAHEAGLPYVGTYLLDDYHHGAQYLDKKEYKKVIPEVMSDVMSTIQQRQLTLEAKTLAVEGSTSSTN